MKKITVMLLVLCVFLFGAFAAGTNEAKTEKGGVGNSLVIYTSNTEAEISAMLIPFQSLYPDVDIEIVNGSFGELFARIQAEKDDPVADIMLGGLSSTDGKSMNLIL